MFCVLPAEGLCLLIPVTEVWLVVNVVLRHKDHSLTLALCVHKLCVLEILLAVHTLALDILLVAANFYER